MVGRGSFVHVPKNVLIVSASMGGGHNGVARELGSRLHAAGHQHRIVDFLDAFPGAMGRMWQRTYQLEMRYLPSMYERSYRLFTRHPLAWRPFVAFETALAKLDVLRWIGEEEPFSSLVLGQLRQRGLVDAPVITFLTDFGIHPRWIHPGVDLHLAVHPQPAAEAARSSERAPADCSWT